MPYSVLLCVLPLLAACATSTVKDRLPNAARPGDGLSQDDSQQAIADAIKQFRNKDGAYRISAAEDLLKLDVRKKVAAAVSLLVEDPDERVGEIAMWTLGEMGDVAAGPALVPALANPSVRMRVAAILALGRIDPEAFRKEIAPLLEDPHPTARALAAETLGRAHRIAPKTGETLTGLLGDKNPGVRTEAARALGRLGYQKAPGRNRLGPTHR